MAHTPCNQLQFRNYISNVFNDQLQGTVNDSRGDKNTARPRYWKIYQLGLAFY
jgi:hypothetical protein